jgi:acyl carrier protein
MTRAEIQTRVVQALSGVAPEIDAASIDPDAPLRDQVDLDSMDFLRYVVALRDQLGVDVPEADYAGVASLSGAVNYLARRLGVA